MALATSQKTKKKGVATRNQSRMHDSHVIVTVDVEVIVNHVIMVQ